MQKIRAASNQLPYAVLVAAFWSGSVAYRNQIARGEAEKVVAAWWDLGDRLLVKYNHFGFYDSEKRTRGRGKPVPLLWQKAVRLADVLADSEK